MASVGLTLFSGVLKAVIRSSLLSFKAFTFLSVSLAIAACGPTRTRVAAKTPTSKEKAADKSNGQPTDGKSADTKNSKDTKTAGDEEAEAGPDANAQSGNGKSGKDQANNGAGGGGVATTSGAGVAGLGGNNGGGNGGNNAAVGGANGGGANAGLSGQNANGLGSGTNGTQGSQGQTGGGTGGAVPASQAQQEAAKIAAAAEKEEQIRIAAEAEPKAKEQANLGDAEKAKREVLRAAIKSNNAFGFRFMKEFVSSTDQKNKNSLFSPISMDLTLAMALNGTANGTRNQLQEILSLEDLTLEQINNGQLEAQKLLVTKKKIAEATDPNAKHMNPNSTGPIFALAQNIFANSDKKDSFALNANFIERLTSFFALSPETAQNSRSIPFKGTGATTINEWAKSNTNKMIENIVTTDDIRDLSWLILQAAFFEGQWSNKFKEEANEKDNWFTSSDGNKPVSVPKLTVTGKFRYRKIDKYFEAVEIPFKQGDEGYWARQFSMIIIMPDADITSDIERAWNQGLWSYTLRALHIQNLHNAPDLTVTIPKFAFESKVTMKKDGDLTKKSRLDFLFQDRADFSGISQAAKTGTPPAQTAVEFIRQNTKLKVTAEGLTAAAVTSMGGTERSMLTDTKPDGKAMIVNHPFMFAIIERNSKAILFMGNVNDPTKQQ